jgi:hypothetical protein
MQKPDNQGKLGVTVNFPPHHSVEISAFNQRKKPAEDRLILGGLGDDSKRN